MAIYHLLLTNPLWGYHIPPDAGHRAGLRAWPSRGVAPFPHRAPVSRRSGGSGVAYGRPALARSLAATRKLTPLLHDEKKEVAHRKKSRAEKKKRRKEKEKEVKGLRVHLIFCKFETFLRRPEG